MLGRSVRRPFVVLAVLASFAAGGIVVVPATASAQQGADDQYTGVDPGGNAGNANDDDDAGEGSGAVEGDGGSLPFTGYPLTPLVSVFLALILAAVVTRAVQTRRGDASTGPDSA